MSALSRGMSGRIICRARPGSRRDRRHETLRRGAILPRLTALDLWERRRTRAIGKKISGVGYIGRQVIEFLMRHQVKHGSLDDLSYAYIAKVIRHARSAVVDACERLRTHGWLDWLRRWEPNPDTGQVEQICNEFILQVPEAELKRMGIAVGPRPPRPPDVQTDEALKARFLRECAAVDSGLAAASSKWGAAIADRERRSQETD